MGTFTSIVGRQGYDWEIILQNVLANGSFSAPTGGGTGLSLVLGTIHLDLTGTGLTISGARTITAGSINGFTLVDTGQSVITMTSLALPTFTNFQTLMNGSIGIQPYGETFKTLFAPFFTNEAVTATGSGDGESIFGSNLVDHINSGGGDDYVRGGNGVDFLDGGTGWDFLDYSADARTVGININLSTNSVLNNNVAGALVDNISNFEGVGGTSFADIIRGNDGDSALIGYGGGDTFYGMAGDNFYRGESGVDTFVGGTGIGNGQWDKVSYEGETGGTGIVATFNNGNISVVDTYGFTDTGTSIEEVKGSQYADTFNGDAGDNNAEGMGGADIFNMGAGYDTLEYTHESDAGTTRGVIVNLSSAAVTATLDAGAETVQGGHARDSFGAIDTLNGVEDIHGTNFNDYIVGNADNNGLSGHDGSDTIFGGDGDDNIRGDEGGNFNQGNDQLFGGNGFDSFKGGAGNDYIDGGADQDRVEYNLETTFTGDDATHGVIVNLSTSALINVSVAGIALTNVAAGTAIDTRNYIDTLVSIEDVQGTGYDDIIVGSASGGNLEGNEGNDKLTGGIGSDQLYGGDGNDILTGGAGNDQLYGDGGNDTLNGGTGDNFFEGGAGTDSYVGGTLVGNNEFDVISYRHETGGSGIIVNYGLAGAVTVTDTYGNVETGIGIDKVVGSQFADTFNGTAANETVEGFAGNDVFNLSTGRDGVDYNHERDDGSTRGVIVNLSAASITATLDAGAETVLAGHARDSFGFNDTLNGVEDIRGTDFNDYIFGSADNNNLSGHDGSDTIRGGAGNDNIRGDEGGNVNQGNDQLFGEDGDDDFKGGAGNDLIDGGAGRDSVDYNSETTFTGDDATHGVIVNLTTSALLNVSVTGIPLSTVAAGTAIDTRNYIDTLVSIERVQGTGYNDIIVADAGQNNLNGFEGADTIKGGLDDDFIVGGAGNDILDGGTGGNEFDTLAYVEEYLNQSGNQGVTVNLSSVTQGAVLAGKAIDSFGNTDTVSNFEAVFGTGFNDTVYASQTPNNQMFEFSGFAGNDTFVGSSGKDRIDYVHDEQFAQDALNNRGIALIAHGIVVNFTGDVTVGNGASGTITDSFGNTDTVSGVEEVRATFFADTFNGGADNESFQGLKGADIINGGGGFDIATYYNDRQDNGVQAGGGAGIIVNFSADVTANGISVGTVVDGFGTIDTLTNIEVIDATDFNDTFTGGADRVEFWGGAGSDTFNGGSANDYADGGNDNDTLNGGLGSDTLNGNAGNDILSGGAGADTLDGGTDFDTSDYTSSTAAVSIFLSNGAATGSGGDAQGDTLISIENLTGSNGFGDTLFGDAGVNVLNGLGGNDTLDGGAGADQLIGGAGTDTAYYYGSVAGVTVNLAAGTGVGGDAQGDTLIGIEQVIGSNTGSDKLTGGNGINYLNGLGGDDVIDGGGVAAPDATYQGDSLDGGAGTDTLSYASSLFGTVVLMGWTSPTAGIAWNGTSGDVMINFENFQGSNFRDVVQGNTGENVINGGLGGDSLYGFGGADTFRFDKFETDVIADFQDNVDKISINSTLAANFSNLTIYGNGTHLMSVVLGDGSQIIVQGDGVTNVTLTASDFMFV